MFVCDSRVQQARKLMKMGLRMRDWACSVGNYWCLPVWGWVSSLF